MSDNKLINVFNDRYSIRRLERLLGYPVTTFMNSFHNSSKFLNSFDNPKFGFATLLCSRSDPKRLLLSLYSLLYVNVINKCCIYYSAKYIFDQHKFSNMFKNFDFDNSEITISTCEQIVSQLNQYYIDNRAEIECGGDNQFHVIDKQFYENILLFVFYEDVTLTSSIKINNIYTVIQWFIKAASALYPNMKIIHMKSTENTRAHVGRNMIQILVRKEFPEVNWLNICDDDDMHTSMALLSKQFYTYFYKNEDSTYKCSIINCLGSYETDDICVISMRLFSTLCPYCLNGLLNSFAVQGEDGISYILCHDLNMIANMWQPITYCNYTVASRRYETAPGEVQNFMKFQQYLRMVTAVDPSAAKKLLTLIEPIDTSVNVYGWFANNEKRNMYEVIPVLVSSDMRLNKHETQSLRTISFKMPFRNRNVDLVELVNNNHFEGKFKEDLDSVMLSYKVCACMKEITDDEFKNFVKEVNKVREAIDRITMYDNAKIIKEHTVQYIIDTQFKNIVTLLDINKLKDAIEVAQEHVIYEPDRISQNWGLFNLLKPFKRSHIELKCRKEARDYILDAVINDINEKYGNKYKDICNRHGFSSVGEVVKNYIPNLEESSNINEDYKQKFSLHSKDCAQLNYARHFKENVTETDYHLFNLKYKLRYNFAIPCYAKSLINEKIEVVVNEDGSCNVDLRSIMENKNVVSVTDGDGEGEFNLHDWNLRLYTEIPMTKLKGGKPECKNCIKVTTFFIVMLAIMTVILVIIATIHTYKYIHRQIPVVVNTRNV
jgi:hypothetical protein